MGPDRTWGPVAAVGTAGARAWTAPPRSGGVRPEFGLYLQAKPPPPMDWQSRWVRWPDWRLPADRDAAREAMVELWQCAEFERVEVACSGGQGRTGTALACLAILDGVAAADAVGGGGQQRVHVGSQQVRPDTGDLLDGVGGAHPHDRFVVTDRRKHGGEQRVSDRTSETTSLERPIERRSGGSSSLAAMSRSTRMCTGTPLLQWVPRLGQRSGDKFAGPRPGAPLKRNRRATAPTPAGRRQLLASGHRDPRRNAVTVSVGSVTVDCNDVPSVAGFWSAALGIPLDPDASPYMASLNRYASQLPRFLFLKVPESKTAKNRLHLDLLVDQAVPRAQEIARLVELGATHVADKDEWGHSWAVLADPRATSSASPPDRDRCYRCVLAAHEAFGNCLSSWRQPVADAKAFGKAGSFKRRTRRFSRTCSSPSRSARSPLRRPGDSSMAASSGGSSRAWRLALSRRSSRWTTCARCSSSARVCRSRSRGSAPAWWKATRAPAARGLGSAG